MLLSWNEIRTKAISFVKEWEGETRERAEKTLSGMTSLMCLGLVEEELLLLKSLSRSYQKIMIL